jgi:hypothetical protein
VARPTLVGGRFPHLVAARVGSGHQQPGHDGPLLHQQRSLATVAISMFGGLT